MLILDGDSAAHSLAFTADGTRLAVWRDERRLEVWDLPAATST